MQNTAFLMIMFVCVGLFLVIVRTLKRIDHARKQEALDSLEDAPFDSVSSEKKMYELDAVYQSNKERNRRNLDG